MNDLQYGISLCMIVKNEEVFLRGCLDSVKDFVDEIVIVDTGSEDATLQIAREAGAKIIETEWNDDFSAARNLSLSEANYEWILVLDADERIAKRDLEQLKQLITQTKTFGFRLNQRTYLINLSLTNSVSSVGEYPEEMNYP